MTITVTTNASQIGDDLQLSLAKTRADLRSVAEVLEGELVDRARSRADGDVLEVHSGVYLRSIQGSIVTLPDDVVATISSDAPGAGLLEYGGKIPAHDIMPNVAGALRFMGSAGEVFAAMSRVPDVTIKPHPVIHAVFEEMEEEIVDDLEAAGTRAW